MDERELLKKMLRNLWQNYKYNQEYTAYLLGGYSKTEFLKIAETYAESYERLDHATYRQAETLLAEILKEPVTPEDIELMLNAKAMGRL